MQESPHNLPKTTSQARRYQAMKNRLFLFNIVWSFLFLLFLVVGRYSTQIKVLVLNISDVFFAVNALYLFFFSCLGFFWSLPFDYFEGFVLEHQFKLSRQSAFDWLKDLLKKSGCTFVITLIVVESVYFFLSEFQASWWLWAALIWFFISIVLAHITPRVILPLFFKTRSLEEGELKDCLLSFLQKYPLRIKDIQVLNFSKKTIKANAMVAGLGSTKQIYLTDTLVDGFLPEEIEVVLAHEIGHYIHRDTFRLVLIGLITSMLSFFVASRFFERGINYFDFASISDIAGLPLLLAILMLLSLFLLPVQNGFTRWLEKRADRFALNATKNPDAFISMMEKLGKKNLAEFSPTKFIEFFLYNHPPLSKRIEMAQRFKENNEVV